MVIVLAALLSGCQMFKAEPPQPEVRYVQIPVRVACTRNLPSRPAQVHDAMNADYPIDRLYQAALVDKVALDKYATQLEIEVKACQQP
jgi:hypothetical protein